MFGRGAGEYSDRIENADELLESFLDNFHEEPGNVQLQLLTAIAKLFLFKPEAQSAQTMLQQVIHLSTQESDNPDLRDRGFIYWRLLSTDTNAAKLVVTSEKPVIAADSGVMEASLLDGLISHVGTLASVYHKLPTAFITEAEYLPLDSSGAGGGTEADYNMPSDYTAEEEAAQPSPGSPAGVGSELAPQSTADLLGLGPAAIRDEKQVVLAAEDGDGMEITAAFGRSGGGVMLDLTLTNRSSEVPISNCHIQFNKNAFGMKPAATAMSIRPANIGQSQSSSIKIDIVPTFVPPPETRLEATVQCAVKSSLGKVHYFRIPVALSILCEEDGRLGKSLYLVSHGSQLQSLWIIPVAAAS